MRPHPWPDPIGNTHFGSRRARWAWVPVWPRRTLEGKREKQEMRVKNEHPTSGNTADTILLPAVCAFLSPG